MSSLPRIAVIGAGAAGLAAAWLLARGGYSVTVFEAHSEPGGHARTISVPIPGNSSRATVQIDVGFMVYNAKTYPDLVSLFELLNVDEENSSMSFSSSVETDNGVFEWASESLSTLFADRSNIFNPSMYAMLWDMRRFNRSVYQYVDRVTSNPNCEEAEITLGEFLDDGGYTQPFIYYYIIPMVSAVWSASLHDALAFPAISLFHFFVNHGLAQVFARPQWRTPAGRSHSYVKRIVADMQKYGAHLQLNTKVVKANRHEAGVTIYSEKNPEPQLFDYAIFATHAPETLDILGESATDDERRILGAFRYSKNVSLVHHDIRLMPRNQAVWSSWNFISRKQRQSSGQGSSLDLEQANTPAELRPVCVSYWLNRLQNLHRHAMDVPNIFISLNPVTPVDESKILAEVSFEHPQFNLAAVEAQKQLQDVIQGKNSTWFCGAYIRYGFHEDAIMTGLDVAERMSGFEVLRPWRSKLSVAMNNNYRVYEVPFSSVRTPTLFYIFALAVIHAVMYRLGRALRKMSNVMTDDDPAVLVAAGDGSLLRFGPRRAPQITSTSKDPATSFKINPLPRPARITIRNAKLFARVTDWLRQGYDLAPIMAASFSAREIDSPTPQDLSQALCSMFVAQIRNNGLTEGFHGQMRLAESLLVALVGGFDKVVPPVTRGRIPELATCISGVVFPAWWRFMDSNEVSIDRETSPVDVHSGSDTVRRRLELIGDLCAETIYGLKADMSNSATIVVSNDERHIFVSRKAQLLGIDDQVTVVHVDEFLSGTLTAKSGESFDASVVNLPGSGRGRYDLILSPAAVNICEGLFGSIERMITLARSLIADDGVVELGFTGYSGNPTPKARRRRHLSDVMFCGDNGYRIWPEQEVLDSAASAGLAVVRITQMNSEAAACEVEATNRRIYTSLAETKLSEQEIRETTSQLCLWEAALRSQYISRTVALLRPC